MPHVVQRRWEGDPGAYGSRRARASFPYQAFVPDPIANVDPQITFEMATEVADAEASIRSLNSSDAVAGLEAVGALLLRSEAIASSRIEGYELTQQNLATALVDAKAARGTAATVAANVRAMEDALSLGNESRPLTGDDIKALHLTLMRNEPARVRPGEFRREQNWIGGRLNSPIDARFIPPPEDDVPRLVADLATFLNRDDLPAVAQAAIAHAQFETIHPFLDGNGRVGRCLIHVVLRRRGVAPAFAPPVSIVLAARPSSYIAGLEGFREGRIGEWCASFAGATGEASILSTELATEIRALQASWLDRAGKPRADSAAARIIRILPAQPITSAGTARAAIGASHRRAFEGLKDLAAAGVIRQISEGDYDRQYAADELFALIEAYETRIGGRSLARDMLGEEVLVVEQR